MQNPFRHHGPDDRDPERDERRWEARDQRFDENRSWGYGGGDGGRSSQAFGGERRDQDRYRTQSDADWTSGRDSDYGSGSRTSYGQGGYQRDQSPPQAYGQGSYGQRSYGQGSYGQGSYQGGEYGRTQGGGMSYGQGPSYGGQGGYSAQGYAPGSEIWRGSGRDMEDRGRSMHSQHEFEPDYLHWREQQLSSFDKDYNDWRHERRQKFSSDFDSWRQSRPRVQAENPIVGDITDGGDGRGGEAAARKR